MASGLLEVVLLEARGIKENDFLGCLNCLNPRNHVSMMDPYVLIQYGNQERTSSVARGKGKKIQWNEAFTFDVDYPDGKDHTYKLMLRIMDKHKLSEDDYVGQTTIYVKDVVSFGVEKGKAELPARKYRIVRPNLTYNGEISVAITFTLNV